MIRHFFLDKTNTIVEKSFQNLGLNPILHVGYGNGLLRGILSFSPKQIKDLIDDKTFANIDKLHCYLKMTNCFSIDGLPYEKILFGNNYQLMQRACSFDLILFKLPKDFDEGRGYEFTSDVWVRNGRAVSSEGSNWYFARNGILWSGGTEVIDLRDRAQNWRDVLLKISKTSGGVYTTDKLSEEYEKFKNGEDSIIIGEQHFDFGDENLEIEITDSLLSCLNEESYNIGISFAPLYEYMTTEFEQYVGFFNDNTNTYFHPYIEVIYDEYINDDRESFTIGKENNLYLYVSDDGKMVNLDSTPSCSINGNELEVSQITKGVYKATLKPNEIELERATIYDDIWSNISLNGVEEDDVELEFSTHRKEHKIKIGDNSYLKNPLVPTLYGIYNDENISVGNNEIREVTVDFRKKYETEKKELTINAEYKVYVKDGNREIDILKYQPIEKAFLNNFFMIYADDLIPNTYYVDIKIKQGREEKTFKDILHFNIVSNVTERYI